MTWRVHGASIAHSGPKLAPLPRRQLGLNTTHYILLIQKRMNAEQVIKKAQQDWAKSRGIAFDSRGYAPEVETNLFQPLSNRARRAFERGAGSELSGHMRALHSSSTLAVNFFDYWTERQETSVLSALGVGPDAGYSLDFEAQFPTGLGGTPPHLDVAITLGGGFIVSIEAKFTEHLKRSTRGKSKFTRSYFTESGGLWADKGLPACQALAESLWAEELRGGRQRFEYLDPRQLLKHSLGLVTQLGSRFSLCYLYYDCLGKRAEAHRREIDFFNELVGEDIRFNALTYQQAFAVLMHSGNVGADYVDYLRTRYFGKML